MNPMMMNIIRQRNLKFATEIDQIGNRIGVVVVFQRETFRRLPGKGGNHAAETLQRGAAVAVDAAGMQIDFRDAAKFGKFRLVKKFR